MGIRIGSREAKEIKRSVKVTRVAGLLGTISPIIADNRPGPASSE
jgi:hypothetical protein